MKYRFFLIVLAFPYLVSSQVVKFSPTELKEDIDYFQKVLYECHPSPFRHYPKDTLDVYFNSFRAKANEEMAALDFEKEAKIILTKIGCIHTAVKKKKRSKRKRKKSPKSKIIPLHFYYDGHQLWTKEALVDSLATVEWCRVLQIGEVSATEIINTLSNYRIGDGYGTTYVKEVLNYQENFNILYNYYFQYNKPDSIIRFQLLNQKQDTIQLDIATILYKKPKEKKAETKEEKKKWDVEVKNHHFKIENNIAFLKIDGFHVKKRKRKKFYKNIFQALEAQNISNFVIDLRDNGGGNINEANLLLSYILDEDFGYDLVRHKSRIIRYARPGYKFAAIGNGYLRLFKPRSKKDGITRIEQNTKIRKETNFNGQVYILTNGLTASSSTVVASYLKHHVNALTIGEETGGGAAGNNGLFYPVVRLKHTKIEVKIPYYWLDFKTITDKGRGILPSIPVHYTLEDIKAGKDLEMEKVLEVIGEKTK